MSKFTEYIGEQFGNPHGFVGKVCCVIMNVINKAMYRKTISLLEVKAEDMCQIQDMEMDICFNAYIRKLKLTYMGQTFRMI